MLLQNVNVEPEHITLSAKKERPGDWVHGHGPWFRLINHDYMMLGSFVFGCWHLSGFLCWQHSIYIWPPQDGGNTKSQMTWNFYFKAEHLQIPTDVSSNFYSLFFLIRWLGFTIFLNCTSFSSNCGRKGWSWDPPCLYSSDQKWRWSWMLQYVDQFVTVRCRKIGLFQRL